MILVLGLFATVVGQAPGQMQFDPSLPDKVRPAVAQAVAAELDPKRGPANAMRIIERAQAKYAEGSPAFKALALRRAAIGLRRIFLTEEDFEEPERYEQALSTFSRLELSDPGFKEWIQRTLDHHPEARKTLGQSKARRINVALLLRGADLVRADVEAAFRTGLDRVGLQVRFVPAKKAAFIVKLAAEGTKSPRPDQRAVRVILGIEHVMDNKVAWRTSLFRTTTAADPAVAFAASLDWLVRVGGRDLVFRWLGTQGLPVLVGNGPLGLRSHDHHDH